MREWQAEDEERAKRASANVLAFTKARKRKVCEWKNSWTFDVVSSSCDTNRI